MKIRFKRKNSVHALIFLFSTIVMIYYFLPISASILTASIMMIIVYGIYFLIFISSNWKNVPVVCCNSLLIVSMLIIFCVREYYKDGYIGVYSIFLVFLPAFLGTFLINKGWYSVLQKLSIIILVSLFITGITTFIGLDIYPELARDLAAFSSDNIISVSTNYNIGGYDIVYCIMLCIPVYCLFIDKKITSILRIILQLAIFIMSIMFFIKTQYTTAMLLGIVNCILIILIRKFDLKRLGIIALIGIVLFSSFKSNIADALSNASKQVESQSISQRLDELSQALDSGKVTGEDMTERGNAYQKSIDAFGKHPVFGTWLRSDTIKLGGHSTILDLMAGSGIILFAIVLLAFFYTEKIMLCKIQDDVTKKYAGIFLIIFCILAIVNPIISGTFFSIFFIGLPGATLLNNRSDK